MCVTLEAKKARGFSFMTCLGLFLSLFVCLFVWGEVFFVSHSNNLKILGGQELENLAP
jgi:preprotein translocase subunit SecD